MSTLNIKKIGLVKFFGEDTAIASLMTQEASWHLGDGMFKILIDIDKTITYNPEFFKDFIDFQMDNGNEVHIVTGALPYLMSDDYIEDGNYEELSCRVKQLSDIGIKRWTKLVSILRKNDNLVGLGKAEYCRDNDIDCVFEDRTNYIESINIVSPKTQCFLIQ